MSKLGKRVWIILLLFLTLLLVSTLALYFASPALAEKALNHWLQKQNYSSIELQMKPPGWNKLEIEQISLTKDSEDKVIHLSSGNIQVSYNPLELYLNHRLESLLLPQSKIRIEFKEAKTVQESESELIDLSGMLPSQWLSKVPVGALRVGELDLILDYPEGQNDWEFKGALLLENSTLYSRINFSRNNSELGWGDLQLNADDQLKLRLLEQDTPFVVLQGQIQFAKQLMLNSKQSITLNKLSGIGDKFGITGLPELSGSLEFEGISSFPVKTRLTPDALLKSIQTQQQLTGHIKAASITEQLESAQINLEGKLGFSVEKLEIELSKSSSAELQGLNLIPNKPQIERASLNLTQPLQLDINLASVFMDEEISPQISPIAFELETSTITLPSLSIPESKTAISLKDINLKEHSLNGEVSIARLTPKVPNQKVPPISVNSQFKLTKKQFAQKLRLKTANLPFQIDASTTTNLTNQKTRANWKLKPIALKNIDRTLANFVKIPANLAVQGGTLFHNGSAHINAQGAYTATLNNSLRKVNFSWDEIFFEGLEQDSRSRIRSNGIISDTGNIKLNKVISGVEITKVQTQYAYEHKKGRDQIKLEATQAELLQGLITFADFGFNPLKPDFSTQVSIKQLDLGEVLALERQQGLSGEGKLNGAFPLRFSDNQLTISDGILTGEQPGGRITFTPSTAVQAYAAANIGLKMAIEALGNFHYDTLEIGLNYLSDGTALLKTRLKGKNPEWNKGHPVDFTINVEENIPKLIKTLQFADKLTKTIEKRYR